MQMHWLIPSEHGGTCGVGNHFLHPAKGGVGKGPPVSALGVTDGFEFEVVRNATGMFREKPGPEFLAELALSNKVDLLAGGS